MKMLLLDVQNNDVKVVEANGLEDYYKYIGCEFIDIVRMRIGDLAVEIICDDEGTFADHPKVSAVDCGCNPMLYGNLLVASETIIDGELTELTDAEIEYVKKFLVSATTEFYKEPYKVFWAVEY